MSIKEIAATLYECRCVLPGCPSKGMPWTAPKPPVLCRWCRRRNWDVENGRKRGRPAKLSPPLRQQTPEQRRAYNLAAQLRYRNKLKQSAALATPDTPAVVSSNTRTLKPENSPVPLIADHIGAPGERSALARVEKNSSPARPAHAPGCSCTLCRLQQERKTGSKRVKTKGENVGH